MFIIDDDVRLLLCLYVFHTARHTLNTSRTILRFTQAEMLYKAYSMTDDQCI